MRDKFHVSTLMTDPDIDPETDDPTGFVPLFKVLDDESDDAGASEEGDEGDVAEIEPGTREVELAPGQAKEDDDDPAYTELTTSPDDDLAPGEARALIDFMRPLSEEEEELLHDPMFRDLKWADDPLHTDDVLTAGKAKQGISSRLLDLSYGENMSEENLERSGCDSARSMVRTLRGSGPSPAMTVAADLIHGWTKEHCRQAAKRAVVSGLHRKLQVEHANFLMGADRDGGFTVRPREYYDNIAWLWARNELVRAKLPTSDAEVDCWEPVSSFVKKANEVLKGTADHRAVKVDLMGCEDTSGWGWNPVSAVTKAVKKAAGAAQSVTRKTLGTAYGLSKKGVGTAYGLSKKGVDTAYKYGKKGVTAVARAAQMVALKPIRAIIRSFTGKLSGRRAAYVASRRGAGTVPTAADKAAATIWSKNFVRSQGGIGPIVSSLMGNDEQLRFRPVDISLAGDDMGAGAGDVAKLILMGPAAVLSFLSDLLNRAAGRGAPAQPDDPNAMMDPSMDPAMMQDPSMADPSMMDPGYADPGYADPGYADPGYADPGYADPGYADPGDYAYGWAFGKRTSGPRRQGRARHNRGFFNRFQGGKISLEQMQSLPSKQRSFAQQLIKSGRLRLA